MTYDHKTSVGYYLIISISQVLVFHLDTFYIHRVVSHHIQMSPRFFIYLYFDGLVTCKIQSHYYMRNSDAVQSFPGLESPSHASCIYLTIEDDV